MSLPLEPGSASPAPRRAPSTASAIHRLGSSTSWAGLRATRFDVRPAHADQLHVDLWWQGQPILLDAGAYRYNAPPPWQNALAGAAVHNTLTVDGSEPMERAGKFLWLGWDQARMLREDSRGIQAEHDGYRRLGVLHQRSLLQAGEDCWRIVDSVLPSSEAPLPHTVTLHYLLPDWPWQLGDTALTLQAPPGQVRLKVTIEQPSTAQIEAVQVVRAGQSLAGPLNVQPFLGWFSPTYNHKLPALSLRVMVRGLLPLVLNTTIELDSQLPDPPITN